MIDPRDRPLWVGIDPGIKGAIAAVQGGQIRALLKMPVAKWGARTEIDRAALADFLATLRPRALGAEPWFVAVEDVHAMPRQGVSSAFSFGLTQGAILGILAAMDAPHCRVPPQTWKAHHRLIGADKRASVDAANALYEPVLALGPGDDGAAEAVLIARWARDTGGRVAAPTAAKKKLSSKKLTELF